jgi:hypothetical protein
MKTHYDNWIRLILPRYERMKVRECELRVFVVTHGGTMRHHVVSVAAGSRDRARLFDIELK